MCKKIFTGLNKFFIKFFVKPIICKRSGEALVKEISPYIDKDDKVLDFGCGMGAAAYYLKKELGADGVGVDIRDARDFNVPFSLYDGETLPFPDKSFDAVLIAYVLHHVDDIEGTLKEVKRVCRGKIIIYEDIPENFLHQCSCWLHGFSYKVVFKASSPKGCFLTLYRWVDLFNKLDLKITSIEEVKFFHPFYYVKRLRFVVSV